MKKTLALSLLMISQISFAQNAKTYAGTDVPAAVQELMKKALAAGATGYNIADYNPYGQTVASATGNMAFSYTEITPEKLAADLADKTTVSQRISGSDANKNTIYTTMLGGTGSISAVYDENDHSDLFARGPQGQKWANNCGILDDGSLHCLPAARRIENSSYILVNPDLARSKKAFYNGHVDIQKGVVVSVEISGKICKAIAKGRLVAINPIALLKAWGFTIQTGLKIRFSNTEAGVPVIDEVNGVLTKAK